MAERFSMRRFETDGLVKDLKWQPPGAPSHRPGSLLPREALVGQITQGHDAVGDVADTMFDQLHRALNPERISNLGLRNTAKRVLASFGREPTVWVEVEDENEPGKMISVRDVAHFPRISFTSGDTSWEVATDHLFYTIGKKHEGVSEATLVERHNMGFNNLRVDIGETVTDERGEDKFLPHETFVNDPNAVSEGLRLIDELAVALSSPDATL